MVGTLSGSGVPRTVAHIPHACKGLSEVSGEGIEPRRNQRVDSPGGRFWPGHRARGALLPRAPAARQERDCDQGSRSQYCLLAGMARITICSPLSKTSTTVSSKRARVSKPSRNSRCGQPSSSRGSIHWHQPAAWTASSGSASCLSALAWTLTPQNQPGRGGSLPSVTGALARPVHPMLQSPRQSDERQRPASVQRRGRGDRVRGASIPRRHSQFRPRRPTSGSVRQ